MVEWVYLGTVEARAPLSGTPRGQSLVHGPLMARYEELKEGAAGG